MRSQSALRIIALAGAIVGCLAAQNAADDPGGWNKAKWGMTQEEVKGAFREVTFTAYPLDGLRGLNLASYPISGRKFSVAFLFDKENHLGSVHLTYAKALVRPDGAEVPLLRPVGVVQDATSKPSRKVAAAAAEKAAVDAIVNAEVNEQIVTDEKEKLLSDMTEKYGNPTTHTIGSEGWLDTFVWLFPSTKISLVWFHSRSNKEVDSVELFYGHLKKSSDL
jgi:hypothetical protein